MNKKDYLHLYLGCECERQGIEGTSIMTGISYDDTQRIWWVYFENHEEGYSHIDDVMPLLRTLFDLTEAETEELKKVECEFKETPYKSVSDWACKIDWMLKKHIDLFGLINAGLAKRKSV